MKLQGLIGGAYTLDSVNVDYQRCVNLYPEVVESGYGKGAQPAYLKGTPGLEAFQTVGDGPIRCVHRDSKGRVLVASGSELYRVTPRAEWSFQVWYSQAYSDTLDQSTDINTSTETFTIAGHAFIEEQTVEVSSSGTLPGGLAASTYYYIKYVDANSFQLTEFGVDVPINITSTGSGTLTITSQVIDSTTHFESNNFKDINYVGDVDFITNNITITSHGLHNGARVRLGAFGNPLPGNLLYTSDASGINYYYVKYIDEDTIQLCTSIANVLSSTEVDLTNNASSYYVGLLATRSTRDPDYSPGGFNTSSGTIIAASSNTDNTKLNATTTLCDGTASYLIFFDDDNGVGTVFYVAAGYEFPGSSFQTSHVVNIDGFYVLNEVDSNNFWASGLDDIFVSPLSFAASEGSPDIIQGLIDLKRDLWVFNERSTEVFVNTGNSDFPFERVQGGFIEVGCAAKYSIAKNSNYVFWLGRSEYGQGVIYMASGLQPQRISTHAIEQEINGYDDITTATAYTYEENGHYFYVLNFDEATWVYDVSTRRWHERAYTNLGTLERHRGQVCEFNPTLGAHLVGDYSTNKLYKFNEAVYTDDSGTITRLRTTPHISSGLKRLFCSRLQLDMEVGVGLLSGQGSDPQVMLTYSDDGGHTWSDESWTSAGGKPGGIGEYKKRVIWRRLSKFRDRIFKFKITDPVKVIIIDAELELRAGSS